MSSSSRLLVSVLSAALAFGVSVAVPTGAEAAAQRGPTLVATEVDTSAPVLSEFDFTPKSVDVSTGDKTVTVTARVTDATGAQTPMMLISSDATTQTAGFGAMTRISGTAQDGTYQRTVTIPATAAPGTWTVKIYPLSDTAGNDDGTFHNHPTKLTVTNGPSEPVATAPDAPTNVTGTRGNASATVTWAAPNENGSPITSYVVTANPGGNTISVGGDATAATIGGLTNGTSYTFTVTAVNAVGPSPSSAPSDAVTPATKPGRVAKPTVVVKAHQATIKWSVPTNGGDALTGYQISIDGKIKSTSATVRKLVAKNLKTGKHRVQVRAINALGSGQWSEFLVFRVRG